MASNSEEVNCHTVASNPPHGLPQGYTPHVANNPNTFIFAPPDQTQTQEPETNSPQIPHQPFAYIPYALVNTL